MIGKRHIVLAALILALGTAVYLNWRFSTPAALQTGDSVSGLNYGDVQFVNGSGSFSGEEPEKEDGSSEAKPDIPQLSPGAQSYFAEAELSRQKARDEAEEVLQKALKAVDSDPKLRQDALNKLEKISRTIGQESKIESLLKAKGFAGCLAFLENGTANILVSGEGLLASQTVTIKDVVQNIAALPFEKIIIVEIQ